MWKAIKPIIGSLLSSKKFLAFFAGVIVWLAAKAGLDITEGDTLELLVLIAGYIVGQGIADHGKEAAKITAAAVEKVEAAKAAGKAPAA